MDVIRYDENSDIVTYDRIISSLMIESDEDADQALKILNSRPDDKDFIIKHYRIMRRDNSHTFSPNNIIIKSSSLFICPGTSRCRNPYRRIICGLFTRSRGH